MRKAQNGKTQQALSDEIGVPKRTYVAWERGEREPSTSCLLALRQLYGIDPAWILEGPEEAPRLFGGVVNPDLLADAQALFDDTAAAAGAVVGDRQRYGWIADLYAGLASASGNRERAAVLKGLEMALKRR